MKTLERWKGMTANSDVILRSPFNALERTLVGRMVTQICFFFSLFTFCESTVLRPMAESDVYYFWTLLSGYTCTNYV